MNNNNKHRTKFSKRNSNTKLISVEYAIISEDGKVDATTDQATAEYMAKEGRKVFIIKTFELTIKQQLKNE